MLDVRIARKDTFQIDPLALDIDPDIEQYMDAVEFVFPRSSLLLELLEVRRMPHLLKAIEVFTALSEQLVPTLDKFALVFVMDHLQFVLVPLRLDFLDENLQHVFLNCLTDDVPDDLLTRSKLEIPHVA